jgi:Cu/Zn superoxide dismutase
MLRTFAILAAVSLGAASLAACGDDTGTGGGATTSSGVTASTTGNGTTNSATSSKASSTVANSGSAANSASASTGGMNAAEGTFTGADDYPDLSGSIAFTVNGNMVTLTVTVENAPPEGMHALHIHENAECDPDTDFNSAGMHWNPGDPTGEMTVENGWLGELGQIAIGADNSGTFTLTTDKWTVGGGAMNDVLGGHSLMIHRDPGGGDRIACALIHAP